MTWNYPDGDPADMIQTEMASSLLYDFAQRAYEEKEFSKDLDFFKPAGDIYKNFNKRIQTGLHLRYYLSGKKSIDNKQRLCKFCARTFSGSGRTRLPGVSKNS